MKLLTGSHVAEWIGKIFHFVKNFQPDFVSQNFFHIVNPISFAS
jgi:hypothetical protein